MVKRKLPKSIRKFIRKEKAKIRRQVLDFEEQKQLINDLYQKFIPSSTEREIPSELLRKSSKSDLSNS